MQRARWILLVIFVAVASSFLFLYTFSKARPDIPDDAVHVDARGQPAACMSCHGQGGVSPRSPNHPHARQECELCHYWKGESR
jgi:cytochrome c553